MKIPKALRLAAQHQQAGRVPEAEVIYRQILAFQPDHADALHRLGLLAQQCSQADLASELIWRAILAQPAVAAYHHDLGNVLSDQGHLEDAAAAYRRAIALRPDCSPAHSNLGIVLRTLRRFGEAIAAYRLAIETDPKSAPAYYNLGNILLQTERFDEATEAYGEALRIQPHDAATHHNLALALRSLDRLEAAKTAYEQALALRPDSPETLLNLGNLRREEGQFDEAITAYQRILAIQPEYLEAHHRLGIVWHRQGQLKEAEAAYRQVLELSPSHIDAAFNYSVLLLLSGDFARGWQLYEKRWEATSFEAEKVLRRATWSGEKLVGQRLLIHAEQGLGDTLQFVRYLPQVVARGGRVLVSCQPSLVELFQGLAGVQEVIPQGALLPPFDLHAPMMSLPLLMGTSLETIPSQTPYLKADPIRQAAWRRRLGGARERWKVGLVWAGNPKHREDRQRSLSLEQLLPLLTLQGIDFYSLQKGRGAEEIASLPATTSLIDHAGELLSYADTAALVMELDLVISVDTSIVHLAGALGQPVWTLIGFSPDWRWMLHRTDSPWYPSMRLFRQARCRAWEPVIAEVRAALAALVAAAC